MNGMVEVTWRPHQGTMVSTRPGSWRDIPLVLPAVDQYSGVDSEHLRNEILTAEQVAGMLGVSIRTIESMARAGRITGLKVGRDWRFSRQGVISCLDGGVRRRGSGKEVQCGKGLPARAHRRLASRLPVPEQGWPDGPVSADDWKDTEGS